MMVELGIVRSVDDLGRVAIPKEIRRTLKIHEGDQVSISVDGDSVIFKRIPKYVAPLQLIDDVINELDVSRWSNRRGEAMQLLKQAREILEHEGEA
jgi:transcriptional pleiotropic regulator of transition state genes